jgi:hypothetical protein
VILDAYGNSGGPHVSMRSYHLPSTIHIYLTEPLATSLYLAVNFLYMLSYLWCCSLRVSWCFMLLVDMLRELRDNILIDIIPQKSLSKRGQEVGNARRNPTIVVGYCTRR